MTNDHFIGLLTKDQIIDLVKKMMSLNECTGRATYQLTKIHIDNSGYAFGICQHDCGQRAEAREFIKKCLSAGSVSVDQINNIMLVLADHTQKLSSEQLEMVNTILLLQTNIEAINQFDAEYISSSVDYVKNVVTEHLGSPTVGKIQYLEKSKLASIEELRKSNLSEIQDIEKRNLSLMEDFEKHNKSLMEDNGKTNLNDTQNIGIDCRNQILNNPIIFLELVDYHNQYHLSTTGLLIAFLNGQIINRSSRGVGITVKIDVTKIDTGLLGEIRRFINEYTEYGIEHRHDCIRRQKNIDTLMIPNIILPAVF